MRLFLRPDAISVIKQTIRSTNSSAKNDNSYLTMDNFLRISSSVSKSRRSSS